MLALVLQLLSALMALVSLVLALWKGGAGAELQKVGDTVVDLKVHRAAVDERLKNIELAVLRLTSWQDQCLGKTAGR